MASPYHAGIFLYLKMLQKRTSTNRSKTGHLQSRAREDLTMLRTLMAALGSLLRSRQRPRLAQDAAANYPNRPIKIIVCVPAGGGVDTVTRVIAEGLEKELGQPVVVENRAGAAGNIGANVVYHSETRTLHAAGRAAGAAHRQSPALQVDQLRSDPVRAGRDHVVGGQYAAGAAQVPSQDGEGIHRLRQGQPRQDQLRFAGHRHHLAPDHGAVRTPHRHQNGARVRSRGRRPRSMLLSAAMST